MNFAAIILSLIVIMKTLKRMQRKQFEDARANAIRLNPGVQATAPYGAWLIATGTFGACELALIYLAVRIGL